jgi:hypothetical protein
VELLRLSSNAPAALTINAQPGYRSGELYTEEGSLTWSIPLRNKPAGRYRSLKDRRFSESFLDAGETVFGPMGVSANYFYDGSSVSGGFIPVKSNKVRTENTFTWSRYLSTPAEALVPDTLTEYLVQPNTVPVAGHADRIPGTAEHGSRAGDVRRPGRLRRAGF